MTTRLDTLIGRPLYVLVAGLATLLAVATGAVAEVALLGVFAGVGLQRGLASAFGRLARRNAPRAPRGPETRQQAWRALVELPPPPGDDRSTKR